MIPHFRPLFDLSDEEAVVRALRSGYIAQGAEVEKFEEAMAHLIGVKYAVAVNSGTAALHLALLSLNIGPGDEVIIPSYVCSALLNAVRYTQAKPVIADIDELTFNISPADVGKKLSPKTKAIVVPHMFGLPADLEGLSKFGIPLIEDCAQSLGSHYHGKLTGSIGRLAVFSFYTTKVIAAGEGGMVLTDEAQLAKRIREIRAYDEKDTDAVRFNYKLTDLQAALGRSQLNKLDSFLNRRQEIARFYHETLKKIGMPSPHVPEGSRHIYFRYCLSLNQPDVFIRKMADRGITCRRPVYRPLHYYLKGESCPVAERVWQKTISIPLYPALTDEEVSHIGQVLTELHKEGFVW